MFGIGMSELIIILAVALLVFGPQKLPEIARTIAKGMRELRRAGDDLRASVDLDGDPAMRAPAHRRPRAEVPHTEPPAQIPGSELATATAPTSPPPADAAPAPWPQPAEGTLAVGSLGAEPPAEGPAPDAAPAAEPEGH